MLTSTTWEGKFAKDTVGVDRLRFQNLQFIWKASTAAVSPCHSWSLYISSCKQGIRNTCPKDAWEGQR